MNFLQKFLKNSNPQSLRDSPEGHALRPMALGRLSDHRIARSFVAASRDALVPVIELFKELDLKKPHFFKRGLQR